MTELGDKLDADLKSDIEVKISSLKKAIQEESYDQIKVLQDGLQQSMMNLGKVANSPSQDQNSSEDTVIDTNSKEA